MIRHTIVVLAAILSMFQCGENKAHLSSASNSTTNRSILIRNISIIDATRRSPQPAMDVTIRRDRIVAVEPSSGNVSADAPYIIDGTGKYLLPGFVDMHVHLLEHGRNDKGEIPPRVDWEWVRKFLRLLLAHGITTARDPGSETESAVTLRQMIRDGKVLGPRLFTAGRIINASTFNPEPFQPVQTAADIRKEIQWQATAGVDFIKVYSSMPPDLIKVAIEEAHANKLPVIGHLQRTTWSEAAEMGIDFLCHAAPWAPEYLPDEKRAGYEQTLFGRVYWLENADPASLEQMAHRLAANDVVIDPTLIAMHTKFFGNDRRWIENPSTQLIPPALVTGWRMGSFTADWSERKYSAAKKVWPKLLDLVKLLYDKKVRLTVGTDAPTPWIVPGASIHEEMQLLVEAGIPAHAVLVMATHNAASALNIKQSSTIAAGSEADLQILTRNPLEDIRNTKSIELVLIRGTPHTPNELLR